MEHMKRPIQQVDELSEEEGSDSEPSVDNFNQRELGELLGAALELKEGEANPFEEQEPSEKSEKVSKKSSDGLEEMIEDSGNETPSETNAEERSDIETNGTMTHFATREVDYPFEL